MKDLSFDNIITNNNNSHDDEDKLIINNYLKTNALKLLISKYINVKDDNVLYEYGFKDISCNYDAIINFKKINNVRYINHFFERRNLFISDKSIFIGNFSTHSQLKNLLINKYPKFFAYTIFILMLIFDFISKLDIVKSFYLFLKKYTIFSKSIFLFSTLGNGRLISKAEVFGRLYSCGFSVIDHVELEDTIFFVARKLKKPDFNLEASFSFLIKLKRVGKDKIFFNVYKFRTMRPYSEYLQEYVYEQHSLKDGGKIKDDFRISYIGKILRKFWIDELPMIFNIFKGEMKIIGVRPLSEHYFNLYSEELKTKRTKFKPGLIPPFYADLPNTLDEIMSSELKYLNEYEKYPIKTDFKYFFNCIFNIVFKGARSG